MYQCIIPSLNEGTYGSASLYDDVIGDRNERLDALDTNKIAKQTRDENRVANDKLHETCWIIPPGNNLSSMVINLPHKYGRVNTSLPAITSVVWTATDNSLNIDNVGEAGGRVSTKCAVHGHGGEHEGPGHADLHLRLRHTCREQ